MGIRPGEKLHEEMITSVDSYSTIDLGGLYAILPNCKLPNKKYIDLKIPHKTVPKDFSYNSFENDRYLDVYEIRELIKKHIDPLFKPI